MNKPRVFLIFVANPPFILDVQSKPWEGQQGNEGYVLHFSGLLNGIAYLKILQRIKGAFTAKFQKAEYRIALAVIDEWSLRAALPKSRS